MDFFCNKFLNFNEHWKTLDTGSFKVFFLQAQVKNKAMLEGLIKQSFREAKQRGSSADDALKKRDFNVFPSTTNRRQTLLKIALPKKTYWEGK